MFPSSSYLNFNLLVLYIYLTMEKSNFWFPQTYYLGYLEPWHPLLRELIEVKLLNLLSYVWVPTYNKKSIYGIFQINNNYHKSELRAFKIFRLFHL